MRLMAYSFFTRDFPLKVISNVTENSFCSCNMRSLRIEGEGGMLKGPSKRPQHLLQHPFDFVERLLNDVERWDGQTVSTFHSTNLSEWPGN